MLNAPNEAPGDISKYASEFVKRLKGKYNGKVASTMWYAWAQGMHNGYGLVAENDQPREPFYRQFLALRRFEPQRYRGHSCHIYDILPFDCAAHFSSLWFNK